MLIKNLKRSGGIFIVYSPYKPQSFYSQVLMLENECIVVDSLLSHLKLTEAMQTWLLVFESSGYVHTGNATNQGVIFKGVSNHKGSVLWGSGTESA